jgi:precorrin-6B methylase 2
MSSSRARALIKNFLLPPGLHVTRIPIGLYRGIRMHLDFRSDSQLFLGLAEIETHRTIRKMLRYATWFVDVGAGMGEMSILFAKRSRARVIAVEPGAFTTNIRQNLSANGVQDATIEARCIASSPGGDCAALDDLDVDPSRPGFVKIDVDGDEFDVLQSGTKMMSKQAAHFLVETHSIDLERKCIDLLQTYGYRITIIPNAAWRVLLPELRPLAHNRWFYARPG